MAIAFSRSLRSLQADGWHFTVIALLSAIVLLTLWCIWFFLSSVQFTASGRVLSVDENSFLISDFSDLSQQQFNQLKRGQLAQVRVTQNGATESAGGQSSDTVLSTASKDANTILLQAAVAQIRGQDLAPRQIRLALLRQQNNAASAQALQQARVDIVIERLSPAQLLLRHIGLMDKNS